LHALNGIHRVPVIHVLASCCKVTIRPRAALDRDCDSLHTMIIASLQDSMAGEGGDSLPKKDRQLATIDQANAGSWRTSAPSHRAGAVYKNMQ